MKIIYKLADIEVVYEDNKSITKIEQDKEIMNMVYLKFLSIYNLKKENGDKLVDTLTNCLSIINDENKEKDK